MPASRNTKLTKTKIQGALVDALNSKTTDNIPCSLASISNRVGQSFKVVNVGGIISKPYARNNQKVITAHLKDLDTETEYSVYLNKGHLRKLQDTFQAIGVPEDDPNKYSNIIGLVMTVTELLEYKGYSYPDLSWSMPPPPQNSRAPLKKKKRNLSRTSTALARCFVEDEVDEEGDHSDSAASVSDDNAYA